MPKRSKSDLNGTTGSRPCITPEAQESMMIDLAMKCAEQQLRDGTASAQVISHFLKLGSSREKLDQELTKGQIKLNAAKENALQSVDEVKELCENAMAAMRRYSPGGSNEDVLGTDSTEDV